VSLKLTKIDSLCYKQKRNHLGSREREYEKYASAFYSRKGTPSAVILSIPLNEMTYTDRILEELRGDKFAPLDWLDFEQKYRDRRPKKENFINDLNVYRWIIRNKDES
jgi:hypothetical protein